MGIKHLLELFTSIWTPSTSQLFRDGMQMSYASSSLYGQESVLDTKLPKATSARFLTFVSQSIFFETGGDRSGAYTNNPNDSGGETKWGISKRSHPHLNIKDLTYKQAIKIYEAEYWKPVYDYILDDALAFKCFDMGILSGRRTAVRLLQKAVKKSGKTIKVDGVFGPITLAAVNNVDPEYLYEIYIKLFDTRFRRLVVRLQKNKEFLRGWLRRLEWRWST